MTSFPVAEEPVKLILSMPGWLVMSGGDSFVVVLNILFLQLQLSYLAHPMHGIREFRVRRPKAISVRQ